MQVKLPPQLQQLIRTGIKSGRFKNTSDAICAALRLLEQRDRLVSAVASDSAVVLGALSGQDIEAIAFLVLMQAAKSAQEDLKTIMKSVKAINSAKSAQRDLIAKTGYDIAENVGRCHGKPSLSFAVRGVGSQTGYHHMPLPYPDPESCGGVRRVPTNMHKGPIKDVCVLRAIRDELKNGLDSMSEMGEMESLRMQMAMDRVSKMMSTLSNLLKKMSDTSSAIISNLK
jgi:putative addiction module CopG family antidote